MKTILLSVLLFFIAAHSLVAQTPVLGNYPATTIATAGNNAIVTPEAVPSNTANIIATASNGFKGVLQVNPVSGILSVTNANPAGNYTITVKAYNGMLTTVSTFLLTVNNSVCSQGFFTSKPDVNAMAPSRWVTVGDFNNDRIQDLAIINTTNIIAIRLGDGSGGFTRLINAPVINTGSYSLQIAVSDFNGDGNQDLAIANGSSSFISIAIGDGAGGFSTTNLNLPDGGQRAIVAGDFNGDGKPDIAALSNGGQSVYMRMGDGAGGFTGTVAIGVGYQPQNLVATDFNNDGNLDFATVNYGVSDGVNTISIRLGNGSGGFSATELSLGLWLQYIVTGDFNRDGNQDIAVTSGITTIYGNNSNILIRLGDGAGGFTSNITVPLPSNATSLTTGDFNGDGLPDLAACNGNSQSFTVCFGNGDGGFAPFSLPVSGNLMALATGDLDKDGLQDIAFADNNSSNALIRTGIPNRAEINITGNNNTIADGDTIPSIADYTDFETTGISVTRTFTIQNTGSGGLPVRYIRVNGPNAGLFTVGGITLPTTIAAGGTATFTVKFIPLNEGLKKAAIIVGNTDCDERSYTYAVQGNAVAVVPGLGVYANTILTSAGKNITITPSAVPINTASITASAPAAFKGVITVNPTSGVINITNAHPAGTYPIRMKAFNGFSNSFTTFNLTVNTPLCSNALLTGTTSLTVGANPRAIGVGDFNGDGIQDLAISVSSQFSTFIAISMGNGNGGFTAAPNVVMSYTALHLAVGEFNGDGKQDLAILNNSATSSNGNLITLLGNGAGGFTPGGSVAVGSGPISISLGDFNSDGRQDMAVPNYNSNTVSIRLGDGAGGFSGGTEITAGNSPRYVGIADINNDGRQDIAICNAGNNYVSIRLGDGTGNFSGTYNAVVAQQPMSIAFGDFNGDSRLDFAAACINGSPSSSLICVRLGNGLGTFSGSNNIPVGGFAQSIALADFNGDGKPDFVVGNAGNNTSSLNLITTGLGDGGGLFGNLTNVVAGTGPYELAIGDFNGDGRQDVATANTQASTVSIKLNSDKEINIKANNTNILSGDTIPSLLDSTDFVTNLAGDSLTRTFTIQNTGSLNLTIDEIEITGINAASFTTSGVILPATIAAGMAATFKVTFTTATAGLKKASVNIYNDDCDEAIYSFGVQGALSGAALQFDGVNDHIVLNNNNAGNFGVAAATISAWVKTSQGSASSIISKKSCTQASFFDFSITGTGHLSIAFGDDAGLVQSLTGIATVNDGNWHQVSAVRSSNAIQLYVDGSLDTAVATSSIILIQNNQPVIIGASGCVGPSGFFNGQMDELRLWSKALTNCEIQNTLNCELTATLPGLIAFYNFNQGRALDSNLAIGTLTDRSANNYNGTLTNFTLFDSLSNWITPGAVTIGMPCGNNVWLGISKDWNNPVNWSNHFTPGECTRVIINNTVPFMPEITDPSAICFSITLNNGATVTIKNTGKLNIAGKN